MTFPHIKIKSPVFISLIILSVVLFLILVLMPKGNWKIIFVGNVKKVASVAVSGDLLVINDQAPTESVSNSPIPQDFCFTKELFPWKTDADVKYLQIFLNINGYSTAELPSRGSETNYYNKGTIDSVRKFQIANGVRQTGNFGDMTRAKVNEILGCSTTTTGKLIRKPVATTTQNIATTTQIVSTTTQTAINPTETSKNITLSGETTPIGSSVLSLAHSVKHALVSDKTSAAKLVLTLIIIFEIIVIILLIRKNKEKKNNTKPLI